MMLSDSDLIFMVSQPRSGSTMLQAVLSNNDFVDTTSEPWLLLPFSNAFCDSGVNAFYDHALSVSGLNEFFISKNVDKLSRDFLKEFFLKIYSNELSNSAKYFLDKTPRYYEILDFITETLPNSKIIVLIRDPIDVLDSIIKTWKVDSLSKLLKYHRDIIQAPKIIQSFISEYQSSDNIRVVRYEDLIENPSYEVSVLYDWLDIEFHHGYLNYQKNKKFHGKYGDPDTVKKQKEIIQSVEKTELRNKKYSSFKKDYNGYLHGNLSKNKMSFFDYYLTLVELNKPVLPSLKYLVKYLVYYFRFGSAYKKFIKID